MHFAHPENGRTHAHRTPVTEVFLHPRTHVRPHIARVHARMHLRNSHHAKIQGIHIYKGTAIKNGELYDKSDAYFVCHIGSIGSSWSKKADESDGFEVRSRTVPNSLDPEWNAFFSFKGAQHWAQLSSLTNNGNEKGLEMTLRIYDEDVGKLDNYLGTVTVTLPKDGHQDVTVFPITEGKAQEYNSFWHDTMQTIIFFYNQDPLTHLL